MAKRRKRSRRTSSITTQDRKLARRGARTGDSTQMIARVQAARARVLKKDSRSVSPWDAWGRDAALGAPEAQHHKRATAFTLEALRATAAARDAGTCRAAFDKLGKAHRAHGGAIAEAAAMESAPQFVRDALRKLNRDLDEVHGMIAGRCLRG